METIIIEENIEMPRRGKSHTEFSKAVESALKQMKAGDSFKFGDESEHLNRHRAVRYLAKRLSIKVTVHKIAEGEYRVWRMT